MSTRMKLSIMHRDAREWFAKQLSYDRMKELGEWIEYGQSSVNAPRWLDEMVVAETMCEMELVRPGISLYLGEPGEVRLTDAMGGSPFYHEVLTALLQGWMRVFGLRLAVPVEWFDIDQDYDYVEDVEYHAMIVAPDCVYHFPGLHEAAGSFIEDLNSSVECQGNRVEYYDGSDIRPVGRGTIKGGDKTRESGKD